MARFTRTDMRTIHRGNPVGVFIGWDSLEPGAEFKRSDSTRASVICSCRATRAACSQSLVRAKRKRNRFTAISASIEQGLTRCARQGGVWRATQGKP